LLGHLAYFALTFLRAARAALEMAEWIIAMGHNDTDMALVVRVVSYTLYDVAVASRDEPPRGVCKRSERKSLVQEANGAREVRVVFLFGANCY
jgi:hypothetical protein